MNRTAGVIKTFFADKASWLFIPHTVLLCSFLVNLVIGYLTESEFYTGGIASIYVYIFILGIIYSAQSFPFLLGFGARRKDFFVGSAAAIILLSALEAVMLGILGAIERGSNGWGSQVHFFSLPYMSDGSFGGQLWVQFAMLTHLFFGGFLLASVHRKFGRNGIYILSLALFLLISFGSFLLTYYDGWTRVAQWFDGYTATGIASLLFLIMLIYMTLSHLLLRRSTI